MGRKQSASSAARRAWLQQCEEQEERLIKARASSMSRIISSQGGEECLVNIQMEQSTSQPITNIEEKNSIDPYHTRESQQESTFKQKKDEAVKDSVGQTNAYSSPQYGGDLDQNLDIQNLMSIETQKTKPEDDAGILEMIMNTTETNLRYLDHDLIKKAQDVVINNIKAVQTKFKTATKDLVWTNSILDWERRRNQQNQANAKINSGETIKQ